MPEQRSVPTKTEIAQLVQQARQVLDDNWRQDHTIPAAGLYPHQWAWDSAFIAMGLAYYRPERAAKELRTLFSGQWGDGMLPHIIFDPKQASYFPGPDFWNIKLSPHAPQKLTSGIVQPPMEALGLWQICQRATDREAARALAKEMYPQVASWHDWLYQQRAGKHAGLVFVAHPWESGRDNSPLWDAIFADLKFSPGDIPQYHRQDTSHAAADERPTDHAYDCFVYLVEVLKRCKYDPQCIRQECPFQVEDVAFNAILAEAERTMGEIAEFIGVDPQVHRQRSDATRLALRELWNDELAIYESYDMVGERPIDRHVASGFLPLFCGTPNDEQAQRAYAMLHSKHYGEDSGAECYPVSTYDREQPGYNDMNYWRGPVWININWFLARGLERGGFAQFAQELDESVLGLAAKSGFREHYACENGEGAGGKQFSWSAALLIDIALRGEGMLAK